MKLFVGLGNPGKTYARHRHNVGFMALERIAARHNLGPWKKRYRSLVTEGLIGGRRVMLLMPQTYMNDSGQAVGEAQRYLKIPEGDIYVFHDEIDLAPSKLKFKVGGGNAGHNGLRSISAHVGNEFPRVRIGVGHPGAKEAVVGYVLHDFSKADQDWLEPTLDAIAEAAGRLAAGDDARFLTDVARRLQGTQQGSGTAGKRDAKRSAATFADADECGGSEPSPKDQGSVGRKRADSTKRDLEYATEPAREPAVAAAGTSVPPPAAATMPAAQPQRGGSLAESLKRWLRGRRGS